MDRFLPFRSHTWLPMEAPKTEDTADTVAMDFCTDTLGTVVTTIGISKLKSMYLLEFLVSLTTKIGGNNGRSAR